MATRTEGRGFNPDQSRAVSLTQFLYSFPLGTTRRARSSGKRMTGFPQLKFPFKDLPKEKSSRVVIQNDNIGHGLWGEFLQIH